MDLKIGMCDDSASDISSMAGLVRKWAEGAGHRATLETFVSAEALAFQYPICVDFQILLLDIEMGKMDGVTLAKRLRRANDDLQIIFVTGYSDYILEGYEVAALYYLLKPVHPEKLFKALDRAVERLRIDERRLTISLGGEMVRLPISRIRYIDVQGNYSTIHAAGEYTVKKTLGELAEALDERFLRVGRSFIINLNNVSRVTRAQVYLDDGSVLPLPRGAYDKINLAILRMGGSYGPII